MKTKPLPVRCNEELINRLKRAAKRMGSNDSAVIRFCVLTVLPQIERGVVQIPAEEKP